MATDIGTTLDGLLLCLSDALEASGRPVCRTGSTVGLPVLGPTACCKDCDEGGLGGQLSAAVARIYPADPATFEQIQVLANCRPTVVAAEVVFTLARCHPTLNAQGVPPSLETVEPFADGANDDLQTMWNALTCPDCGDYKLMVQEAAIDPNAVEGGCSAVGVVLTVLVKPATPTLDVS